MISPPECSSAFPRQDADAEEAWEKQRQQFDEKWEAWDSIPEDRELDIDPEGIDFGD